MLQAELGGGGAVQHGPGQSVDLVCGQSLQKRQCFGRVVRWRVGDEAVGQRDRLLNGPAFTQ